MDRRSVSIVCSGIALAGILTSASVVHAFKYRSVVIHDRQDLRVFLNKCLSNNERNEGPFSSDNPNLGNPGILLSYPNIDGATVCGSTTTQLCLDTRCAPVPSPADALDPE